MGRVPTSQLQAGGREEEEEGKRETGIWGEEEEEGERGEGGMGGDGGRRWKERMLRFYRAARVEAQFPVLLSWG